MLPDRKDKPSMDSKYVQMLRSKAVEGRRIYTDEVVDNILSRESYLEQAMQLQHRADEYIQNMGSVFSIEMIDPADILHSLTERTLQNVSSRIIEIAEDEGKRPKIFLALAGPGGAGKDTVFENAAEDLSTAGENVGRVSKFTTRDSSRPGAYHFRDTIVELHKELGDVHITDEEAEKLQSLGVNTEGHKLGLESLQSIQTLVEDGEFTEWNIELDRTSGSLIEYVYRRNRGWYVTDGQEIVRTLADNDIAVITGNPQNLAHMMGWIKSNNDKIIPVMTYVLPAYPSQFISAARSIARDGVDQSDQSLLSTTGPRQTDEMGIFTELLVSGDLNPQDVLVLENDRLVSDPEVSNKVETLAGQQLAKALLGKYNAEL